MHLVLIRGLPGSGKSTCAREDFPTYAHIEADMYFMDAEGNYKYNPSKIKQAHAWCRKMVIKHMQKRHEIVVSNTFTQLWEMQPYFDLAKKFDYRCKVISLTGNYGNIHGVPEEVIERMRKRWEKLKGIEYEN